MHAFDKIRAKMENQKWKKNSDLEQLLVYIYGQKWTWTWVSSVFLLVHKTNKQKKINLKHLMKINITSKWWYNLNKKFLNDLITIAAHQKIWNDEWLYLIHVHWFANSQHFEYDITIILETSASFLVMTHEWYTKIE